MAKQAVAIKLRMLKTLVMDFLVFKPQFSRRLSRIFFSASSWLSRNFRGRLAGLAQIAAGGRLSRPLRGLVGEKCLLLSTRVDAEEEERERETNRSWRKGE